MNHLPRLTAAFAVRGFNLIDVDNAENDIIYRGIIETTQFGNITIDFTFQHGIITEFPTAYISTDSQNKGITPYHFPHINYEWSVCYHDNSKVFDIYNLAIMVQFCIDAVKSVLNDNTLDDMTEISKEFESYWHVSMHQYFGMLSDTDDWGYINKSWIVGKENALKLTIDDHNKIPIFCIDDIPTISGIDWPIDNFPDLKKWLGNDNVSISCKIESHILNHICSKRNTICLIIKIKKQNLLLGIKIFFLDPAITNIKKKHLNLETAKIALTRNHTVDRFTIDNYSVDKYINSNGKNNTNLLNKKILLIGAGTIGSNLANILLRNGAGGGNSSKFTIVDYDKYLPYNFSRHFLGIKTSGQNKSEALKCELEYIAPFSNIIAETKNIQYVDMNGFDIIIDSTGEESLTLWLNEKINLLKNDVLFLSIWVKGNGEKVECFSMTNNSIACHECFRKSEFYKPPNNNDLPLRNYCNSVFVPFPVSASLYASLLAVHILDERMKDCSTETIFYSQSINPVQEIEKFYVKNNLECSVCGKFSTME